MGNATIELVIDNWSGFRSILYDFMPEVLQYWKCDTFGVHFGLKLETALKHFQFPKRTNITKLLKLRFQVGN